MLRTVVRSFSRFGATRVVRGLSSASNDLLPPLTVAVTASAGQIGYALVMRIARYVCERDASLSSWDAFEDSFGVCARITLG